MSDDTDATIHVLPRRGDDEGAGGFVMPDAPLDPFELPTGEPEFLDEPAVDVPAVPEPMSPADALTASPMSAPPDEDGEDLVDDEDGEPVGPRPGVLERIADWIDYRIRLGDARHAAHAPLREAEIAAQIKRLNARTARDVGLAEQHNQLRQARLKAAAARASAGGKAGVDHSAPGKPGKGGGIGGRGPASGLGADKGGHKPGRDVRKNPHHRDAAGANERHRSKDKHHSDGHRDKGHRGKGDKAGHHHSPRDERRMQRAKARDDRRAARDAGKAAERKAERKGENKAADHRRKEAADQAAHQRREAERDAEHRRKEEAKDADLKREKKRRNLDKDTAPDGKKGDSEKGSDSDPEKDAGKEPAAGPEKGPEGASGGSGGAPEGDPPGSPGPAPDEPGEPFGGGPESAQDAGPGEETAGKAGDGRGFWDRFRKEGTEPAAGAASGPVPAEEAGITVERTDRSGPAGAGAEPAALAPGPRGLPPASEPHTERPGTTRTTQEEPKVSAPTTPASTPAPPRAGASGLAAQHQTNVTLDSFLRDMAHIAQLAQLGKERGINLATALGKVADVLTAAAAELLDDHNIDPRLVADVTARADQAAEMKAEATHSAASCATAAEAALLAAQDVARTYQPDREEMDDAGLQHASAAVHHE